MNLPDWQISEQFIKCYGPFWTGLLDEFLGIVTGVARRTLSEDEAMRLTMSRFCELMSVHVPACREAVATYEKRQAGIRAEETRARVAYQERRELLGKAEAERQRKFEEQREQAVQAARRADARALEEARRKLEVEHRERQAKRDQAIAEEAAEAERLIAQLG
jgi:hypothetical protein